MKSRLCKAVLCAALVIVTAFSPAVGAMAATEPSPWASAAVREAISLGLVPSWLREDYQAKITREDFCYLLMWLMMQTDEFWQAADKVDYDAKPFTDTDARAVSELYQLGLVSGVGGGAFNASGEIAREEAAVILYNVAKFIGVEGSIESRFAFSDADRIAPWAKDAVNFAYNLNLMSTVGNDAFGARMTYTVEQAINNSFRLFKAYAARRAA